MKDINESEFVLIQRTARLLELEPKIRNLSEKIEILKVRQEIESTDFTVDLKALQEEMNKLNSEKNTLTQDFSSDETLKHPALKYFDESRILRERISKLEEKRSDISPNVFQNLLSEYQEQLGTSEENFSQGLEALRSLYSDVKTNKEQLGETFEEIKVRNQLGEIDDETFKKKTSEMSETQKKIENFLLNVSRILEFVQ